MTPRPGFWHPQAQRSHGDAIERRDGGSLRCAQMLLLIRDRTAELSQGTILHVTTDNPIAPIGLPAWCGFTGHEWLGRVEGPERPTFAIVVAPKSAVTKESHPWKRA